MTPDEKEFERWFALQNQTIGKRMARAAWEYQQVRIVMLRADIEEAKSELRKAKRMADLSREINESTVW
jgi:hypothetical protein